MSDTPEQPNLLPIPECIASWPPEKQEQIIRAVGLALVCFIQVSNSLKLVHNLPKFRRAAEGEQAFYGICRVFKDFYPNPEDARKALREIAEYVGCKVEIFPIMFDEKVH